MLRAWNGTAKKTRLVIMKKKKKKNGANFNDCVGEAIEEENTEKWKLGFD